MKDFFIKNKLIDFLSLIIFKLTLDFTYVHISTFSFYAHRYPYNLNITKYIYSWVLIIIFYLLVKNMEGGQKNRFFDEKSLIHFCIQMYYLRNFLPSCTYYALSDGNNFAFIMFVFFWINIISLNLIFADKSKTSSVFKVSIPSKNLKMLLYYMLVILDIIVIVYQNYKMNGRLNISLELKDVYDLRENYSKGASVLEGMMLFSFAGVINPFLAIYSFSKKRYFIFIFFSLIQVIAFSIAGHKSQLFIIPAVLILTYFFNKGLKNHIFQIFAIMSCISVLLFAISNNDLVIDLFRRVFITPCALNSKYIEYFSNHPKVFLTEDIFISRLASVFNIRLPYDRSIAYIVSEYWDANHVSHANTGSYAYAYADFGVIGIILYSVLFTLSLHMIKNIVYDYPQAIKAFAIILLTSSMISIPFNFFIYQTLFPLLVVSVIASASSVFPIIKLKLKR